MARQAGARRRLLRHRVPAHLDGRGGRQRGRRLPLSAAEERRIYEPAGIRGDGPTAAARYWGLGQQEYYQKADVWPLNPQGEIFCILQIEDTRGVENLDAMLTKVPGIGAILIGEGDLGQELGYPAAVRASRAAQVDGARGRDLQEAQRRGRPSARREPATAERIVKEGYRFLMCAPVQSYGHLTATQKAVGRT